MAMSIIDKTFESDKFTAVYLVGEVHEGHRLDQFLKLFLGNYSREQIKAKIKRGEISIIGRPGVHRPSTVLHYGEKVLLTTHKEKMEDEFWRGEKLALDHTPQVVFEDEDLIVANKPPFMTTHPTGRHLFNCATVFFSNIHGRTIHSIHRIDRETSGIQLLGKNPAAAGVLTNEFESRKVWKCYLFIAKEREDFTPFDQFVAQERMGPISEGRDRVHIQAFPQDSDQGKSAFTTFKLIERQNGYVIGLAFPKTGRQHQIRVHAKAHGFPLIGDKLYLGSYPMFQRFKDGEASEGDHDLMELPRHALHALAINIMYRGNYQTFICSLPLDFKEWLTAHMKVDLEKLEARLKEEVASFFKR